MVGWMTKILVSWVLIFDFALVHDLPGWGGWVLPLRRFRITAACSRSGRAKRNRSVALVIKKLLSPRPFGSSEASWEHAVIRRRMGGALLASLDKGREEGARNHPSCFCLP